MFCPKCGKKLPKTADFCSECGTAIINKETTTSSEAFGWGILGFFIPLVGFLLYIMWRDEKPVAGKAAGIGTLISIILGFVLSVIILVSSAAMAIISGT